MARYNPVKLYIVKQLYTVFNNEENPISAQQFVEYLAENNISYDEESVIREIRQLQSLNVPIYASEQNRNSFFIAK